MNLIDQTNILKFLLSGGKFLYSGSNYQFYTISHILNSIHVPSSIFRSTNIYPNTIQGANSLIPVQQINQKNIQNTLSNLRLSINDNICVYGEKDNEVLDVFYVIYILNQFGFTNVYYFNYDYKNLSSDFLTQDYPVWENICNNYDFNDNSIQAQELVILNNNNLIKIIDVRSPASFAGLNNIFKVNGHIQNSVNIFWKRFFVPITKTPLVVSQVIKPLYEIERILLENGFDSKTNIVLTCNTGSEITSDWFIIKTLLGWNNIRLFTGAWNVYQYLHQINPKEFPIQVGN